MAREASAAASFRRERTCFGKSRSEKEGLGEGFAGRNCWHQKALTVKPLTLRLETLGYRRRRRDGRSGVAKSASAMQ